MGMRMEAKLTQNMQGKIETKMDTECAGGNKEKSGDKI